MNDHEIPDVVDETRRFLKKLETYRDHVYDYQAIVHGDHTHVCAQRAALKRASLDLSRSLSRLRDRKP
jgi:hypothetical protein